MCKFFLFIETYSKFISDEIFTRIGKDSPWSNDKIQQIVKKISYLRISETLTTICWKRLFFQSKQTNNK